MTERLAICVIIHMIATIILMVVHWKTGAMKYAKEKGRLLSVILLDCVAFEPLVIASVLALLMMITDTISTGSNVVFDYFEERKKDKEFKNKEGEI